MTILFRDYIYIFFIIAILFISPRRDFLSQKTTAGSCGGPSQLLMTLQGLLGISKGAFEALIVLTDEIYRKILNLSRYEDTTFASYDTFLFIFVLFFACILILFFTRLIMPTLRDMKRECTTKMKVHNE